MAAKDAASNAANTARVSAAERKRSEEQHRKWEQRQERENAIELALKMCPPDIVRTADSLLSDAEKIAAFISAGKLPKKRGK